MVIPNKPKYVTRYMRTYIEDIEKELIKKKYQRYCANFLAKYGGLGFYDEDVKNRYIIDHEDIHGV